MLLIRNMQLKQVLFDSVSIFAKASGLKNMFMTSQSYWDVTGSLVWKTFRHSCPAVTTTVSPRLQTLSNTVFSRHDDLESCTDNWDKFRYVLLAVFCVPTQTNLELYALV